MSDIGKELAERLSPRACFDLLYAQAAARLRDDKDLRGRMSLARELSDYVAIKRQEAGKRSAEIRARQDAMEIIPWPEVASKMAIARQMDEFSRSIGIEDWAGLPTIPTGSRYGGGKLLDEITKRHPQPLKLSNDLTVNIDKLSQRNRYAHLLMDGICFVAQEVKVALEEIRNVHSWRDKPIVFIPPTLFTGYIPLKISSDQVASGECAALPPIESVMILSWPETGEDYYWREVMVVWFGVEYGIPDQLIAHLSGLNFPEIGIPCGW